MRTKNIKLTHTTHDIINIKDSPAAAIELVILLSVIGSSNAAESLNISDDNAIFIIGYTIIKIIIIKPIEPIAFFIINEYPATEEIASDSDLPTIGIKLSIVNFVVLSVTASIVEEGAPLIVRIATNIVIIIPWSQTVDFLINPQKFDNLGSVEILLANCNTNVIKINGIITFK